MISGESVECPACGGAGGGPFGRAGSAWDVESYECPRCEGTGRVALLVTATQPRPPIAATAVTGLAKTTADPARRPETGKDAKRGPKKAPSATPAAAMTRGAKKTATRKSRG
jgi:hypothetical protein